MKDVCDALFQIMNKGVIGETYHISTNNFVSIKSLCNKIAKKIHKNKKNIILIKKDRVGKDQSYKLSSKKIRSKFKWKDKVSLDNGLDRTIAWCLDNLKKISKKEFSYKHKK